MASELLKRERLNEIRGLGPGLLERLIGLYLETVGQRLVSFDEALGAGDAEAAREAAHSIKGSSANIGATQVWEIAGELERITKAGSLDGTGPLAQRLHEAFGSAAEALGRERADATAA